MMRKSMFALGLGLALSLAGAAGAQQTGQQDHQGHGGRPGRGGQWEGRGPRGGGPEGFLLKGITLTDAQKSQLKTLREQDRAQFESRRGQGDARMQQMREARQKGDTAAMRQLRDQFRSERQAEMERHAQALRGILTPAQRTQFDANLAEAKQRQAQRDSAWANGRGGERGGRRGHDRDSK